MKSVRLIGNLSDNWSERRERPSSRNRSSSGMPSPAGVPKCLARLLPNGSFRSSELSKAVAGGRPTRGVPFGSCCREGRLR